MPRNWVESKENPGQFFHAKILPTWDPDIKAPHTKWKVGNVASPLPFQPEFWAAPSHNPAGIDQLQKIKGFITALPIHWTEGENIKFDYPTALVAGNDQQNKGAGDSTEQVVRVGRSDPAQDSAVARRDV